MNGSLIITTTNGKMEISVDSSRIALKLAEEINMAIQAYEHHRNAGSLTPEMTTYRFTITSGRQYSVACHHYLVLATISSIFAF